MRSLPQDLIQRAVEFHGHLGPYMMLGLRVGWLAKTRLGVGPFELHAEVGCPPKPPGSCFLDGIQVGSGCTLGKANLRRKPRAAIWASFEAPEGNLSFRVRPEGIDRVADAFAGGEDIDALCMEIASGKLDSMLLEEADS